jgi:glycosyltransferase involved in cell wall biosynthesis
VLVIDDGSKDNSLHIANSFPCKIFKLNDNQGAAVARNVGAKNAHGDTLLFIDSDIVIKVDTLNLFVESLKKYPAVFGIYTQKPGTDGLLSLYQNFYAHKSIKETREITSMFYSYCAAIKKEIFDQVGGFDESWVRATFEDVEFGMRITERGHQVSLNKNIEVTHFTNYTVKPFIKNYFYKSLDLSKLMFNKKRLTLNNEGWTNYKNFISFLAGLLIIPCTLALYVRTGFIVPLLACVILFIALNFDFYTFILKEKPMGLLPAFLVNFMVQIISACGIIAGQAIHFKEKVV